MSTPKRPQKFSTLARLLILTLMIVLIGAVTWIFVAAQDKRQTGQSPTPNGQSMTVEGEVVCLPHKDTGGPQTMECAYGLKTADGTYYWIKPASDDLNTITQLTVGTRVRIEGAFTQEDSIYQSKGTLVPTSVTKL
jgi:hypothetical protein